MSPKPVIFLSAVSGELKSARQLVANTLTFLGYEPEWQDIFGTEEGDLSAMLRRRIDACAGVVQLVGNCYGFEPRVPDETFGRVSYTQYEALYARQQGKKVWYLFLNQGFPTDVCPPESEEKRALQADYIQRLRTETHLRHRIDSQQALEASVLKLRDDLTRLRRGVKQWAALVLVLLVILVLGMFFLIQRQNDQHEQVLAAMRELPQKMSQPGEQGDETTRMARAYAVLEEKLKLPKGTLEKQLPQFAETLLTRADTSALDRASALFVTKKFAEAEAEALVAKDKALAGGKPVQDAVAALKLAGQAAREQIHYARALEHFRAAAAFTSQERDPLEWARVQWEVASVLGLNGQNLEAEAIYRQVDAIFARALGAEHHDTLSSRSNLASALYSKGRYAEAEAGYRAVLAVQERVLGVEHPETLITRNNLASALYSQGKNAEAAAEHQKILAIRERVLGAEHPDTLMSRTNLVKAVHFGHEGAEAEKEYRAVLAIQERTLGVENPETLGSCNNLARALGAQGKHAEAEKELRAVLAIQERTLGADHPDTLISRNGLACNLVLQGKAEEAEREIRPALEIITRVLGAEHPNTICFRDTLGEALRGQDKLAAAETEHRAVLAAAKRMLNPEHYIVVESSWHLALTLEAQKKWPEALDLAKRVEAARTKALGAEHKDTLEARTLRIRLESDAIKE